VAELRRKEHRCSIGLQTEEPTWCSTTCPRHSARSADKDGVTLIQWCAYHGDVSAIRFLLANGESLDSLGANFDLHAAAFHGHWQLLPVLARTPEPM